MTGGASLNSWLSMHLICDPVTLDQHECSIGDPVDLDNDPPMYAVLCLSVTDLTYMLYVRRSGLLNHIDSAFLPMTLIIIRLWKEKRMLTLALHACRYYIHDNMN